jgi:hypothetical protein
MIACGLWLAFAETVFATAAIVLAAIVLAVLEHWS